MNEGEGLPELEALGNERLQSKLSFRALAEPVDSAHRYHPRVSFCSRSEFRHAKTPPFLRRRLVQFIVGMIVVSAAMPVSLWLLRGRLPAQAYIAVPLIPGIGCGAIGGFYAASMRRQFKRAHDAGGRMCWNCGYALAGLADDGRCPECGRDYRLRELRENWKLSEWSPATPPGNGSEG